MRELNKIAEDLFNLIRSRFENVNLGDKTAKSTIDPENARFFNFDYINKSGKKFGNITISILDETGLKIFFTKDISKNLTPAELNEWYSFLRNLRQFAKRNLLSFDTRDVTKTNLQVRDLEVASQISGTYSRDEVSIKESKKLFAGTHKKHINKNKYVSEFERWASQINEGVWKTPDIDTDLDEIRNLLKHPIEAGNDGINAIGAIEHLIGSDSLFDEFENQSDQQGPTSDVRPLIIQWLHDNGYKDLANEITQKILDQTTQPFSNQSVVSTANESVNTIIKLAGLKTLRRI